MKLIIKERGMGKTTDLIRLSAETGQYILVADFNRARNVADMARKMGLNIPYPVTVCEGLKEGFRGTFIRSILIDDADIVLQMVFHVGVTAITLTKEDDKSSKHERRHKMIKKYVDENGVKTVYLCLFGKRYIWKDGVYQGWYRA